MTIISKTYVKHIYFFGILRNNSKNWKDLLVIIFKIKVNTFIS